MSGRGISPKAPKPGARENAAAVLEYVETLNARPKDAAAHFGKSQPAISMAL